MSVMLKSHQRGMTLIESIIAIVILGIAMVSLTSLLFPNIRDSATPHYQTRAIALGQSFMSQILARNFDHNSDYDGGVRRCDGFGSEGLTCTTTLGSDTGETNAGNFNDVDDYIGCWYTDNTQADCISSTTHPLADVFGSSVNSDYPNFRVEVDVFYDANMDGNNDGGIGALKRIEISVTAGQYGSYPLVAYKGNY